MNEIDEDLDFLPSDNSLEDDNAIVEEEIVFTKNSDVLNGNGCKYVFNGKVGNQYIEGRLKKFPFTVVPVILTCEMM